MLALLLLFHELPLHLVPGDLLDESLVVSETEHHDVVHAEDESVPVVERCGGVDVLAVEPDVLPVALLQGVQHKRAVLTPDVRVMAIYSHAVQDHGHFLVVGASPDGD